METIFRETVKISLMANWLIIAVVLLRMLLKKAPANGLYALGNCGARWCSHFLSKAQSA